MPELPEVETARRTLEPLVVGRRIKRVEVLRPEVLRTHAPEAAARILTGRTITGLTRRGKALLFALSGGWTMTFHFSLWGTVLAAPEALSDKATAVVVGLDRGRVIEFRELQLSNLHLYPTAHLGGVTYLASLGVDPLDGSVTPGRFRELLAGRGVIRALLTDQTRLAGIGNLWANEILFGAKLRPARKAPTLSDRHWRALHRAARSVLQRAIRAGGEPEFVDAVGRKGRFRLAVYGRGGQPCRMCGATIVEARAGGRPSFHCPRCQQ